MSLSSISDDEFKNGLIRMKEKYFPTPNIANIRKMNQNHFEKKLNSNKPLSIVMGNNTSLSLQKRILKYGPEKSHAHQSTSSQQF